MGVLLLKGNEMENAYQHSHLVPLHHFTSNDKDTPLFQETWMSEMEGILFNST